MSINIENILLCLAQPFCIPDRLAAKQRAMAITTLDLLRAGTAAYSAAVAEALLAGVGGQADLAAALGMHQWRMATLLAQLWYAALTCM